MGLVDVGTKYISISRSTQWAMADPHRQIVSVVLDKQSGTLHFHTTYGWSHKIATSQYLLQAEMVCLFNCYGVLTREHHFNDFAKLHHN